MEEFFRTIIKEIKKIKPEANKHAFSTDHFIALIENLEMCCNKERIKKIEKSAINVGDRNKQIDKNEFSDFAKKVGPEIMKELAEKLGLCIENKDVTNCPLS